MTDKELEKLHNEYSTKLRQEYNRFEAEMRKRLVDFEEQIREMVKEEVNIHLPQIENAIQQIHAKINKHFGS